MKTNEIGRTKTQVFQNQRGTTVRYWATDVVVFDENEIVLNTGGWFTNTTKRRQNQASVEFGLGYTVYAKDFKWYVDYKGKTYAFDANGSVVLKRG